MIPDDLYDKIGKAVDRLNEQELKAVQELSHVIWTYLGFKEAELGINNLLLTREIRDTFCMVAMDALNGWYHDYAPTGEVCVPLGNFNTEFAAHLIKTGNEEPYYSGR